MLKRSGGFGTGLYGPGGVAQFAYDTDSRQVAFVEASTLCESPTHPLHAYMH